MDKLFGKVMDKEGIYMKRKWTIFFLFVVISIMCIGCYKTAFVDQPNFIKSDNSLSNGTLNYIRLPQNWQYYPGNYPYRIGTVVGGNALLASDEEGTFVKERKPLLDDMDYAPWVREDYVFPNLFGEDIVVWISGRTHDFIIPDGQAREEFMAWFSSYTNSINEQAEPDYETINSLGIPDVLNNLEYNCGGVFLQSISVPGLWYNGNCDLLLIDSKLYVVGKIYKITDRHKYVIGTFDENTAIYQLIKTLCQGDGSVDTLKLSEWNRREF